MLLQLSESSLLFLPWNYATTILFIVCHNHFTCRHANSHFDDDQLQRDMELAHQMAIAESSRDAMVIILPLASSSHIVLIIVAVDHDSFQ